MKLNHGQLVRIIAKDVGVHQDMVSKVLRSMINTVKQQLAGLDGVHLDSLGFFVSKMQEPHLRKNHFDPERPPDLVSRRIVPKFIFTEAAKTQINTDTHRIK